MTERQGVESNGESNNHASLGTTLGEKSTGFQSQEPHAQTKSTQQAPEAFADLSEHEGQTAKDSSSEEHGHQITTLHSIANWRAHYINDKYLIHNISGEFHQIPFTTYSYSQCSQECSREEDLNPVGD